MEDFHDDKGRVYVVSLATEGLKRGARLQWIEIPFFYHRELGNPEDEVSSATLLRRKRGFGFVYKLQIAVRKAAPTPQNPSDGVTIAPSGLRNEKGQIIAFTWQRGDESGQELLPAKIERALKHAKDLQRILHNTYQSANEVSKRLNGLEYRSQADMHRAYENYAARSQKWDELRELKHYAYSLQKSDNSQGDAWDAWDMPSVAMMVREIKAKLGLSTEQANAMAPLIMFEERYRHLLPWATNEETNALRQRREFFRVYTKLLCSGASVTWNVGKPRETEVLCPSGLKQAIESFTSREGLPYVEVTLE